MELLSQELRSHLPKLYSQEQNDDPIVYAKFFFPTGRWTWFITEGQEDGDDFTFFGYVVGDAEEWGYFRLKELDKICVRGITIERDIFFEPATFSEAIAKYRSQTGE